MSDRLVSDHPVPGPRTEVWNRRDLVARRGIREGPESTCAVRRRRFSSGCKAHPATAPAGSSRSRHGGDEMSEAFG